MTMESQGKLEISHEKVRKFHVKNLADTLVCLKSIISIWKSLLIILANIIKKATQLGKIIPWNDPRDPCK